jgi:hypothetical protein
MYFLCLKNLSFKNHVEKIMCTQTNNYIHLQITKKNIQIKIYLFIFKKNVEHKHLPSCK